jgi:hypothetical protein
MNTAIKHQNAKSCFGSVQQILPRALYLRITDHGQA